MVRKVRVNLVDVLTMFPLELELKVHSFVNVNDKIFVQEIFYLGELIIDSK